MIQPCGKLISKTFLNGLHIKKIARNIQKVSFIVSLFSKMNARLFPQKYPGCKGCVNSEGVSIWSHPLTNFRNNFLQVFHFLNV